jgi:putative endonuclease
MFYTYILFSPLYNKYYIGYTHDIEGRLIAHNHPKNKGFTKKYQPWEKVFIREFDTKKEAMQYETYLKSLKSKKALLELIEESPASSLGSYPDEIGT